MDRSIAGWRPDPYGRFEQRYHDGSRWTEHVVANGVPTVDPWGGGPAPATPAPPVAPDPPPVAPAVAPPGPPPVAPPAPPPGAPPPAIVPVPVPNIPPPSGWDTVRARRFQSIRGLAVALTWMLGASVVVLLASTAAFAHRRSLLTRVHDGGVITHSDATRADDYVRVASGAELLLGIAVLVVLIVLLYRASRNTELWEHDRPRWAAGWTIGGWFIPCASYVIPFLVAGEIWRRTPLARSDGTAGRRSGSTAALWCWWIAWTIGNLLFLGARGGESDGGNRVDSLIDADGVRITGSLILVAASVLLVVVVRILDRRQRVLAAGLTAPESVPRPPVAGTGR